MKDLVLNGLFNYMVASIVLIWALYRLTLVLLISGKEWINSSASLKITGNELVNQLNFYSSGIIAFEEIKETKIVTHKDKQYLLLALKQPQKFIARKSILKRILLRKALKQLGAPIIFQNDQIEYDLIKLQTIINSHLS